MKQTHPTLKSILFCPNCGQHAPSHLQQGNHFTCASCGLQLFFNAAAATAVILTNQAGEILLLRRSREPGRGKLGFPGGFVDCFEAAESAAVREINEECGLVISEEELTYFCSEVNRYEYKGVVYASCDLYYRATKNFSSARPLEETSEVMILAPEEIKEEDFAFESAKNAWRKYYQTILNDIK